MRREAPIRILMLEDNARDAELARALLEEAAIAFDATVVDSREGFVSALETGRPDLILADYSLPSFDGMSALQIARERASIVPFIFVSGSLGEEVAIDTLKNGATDYVLKHRIDRLVPAVQRALRERDERRVREQLQRQREELHAQTRVQAEQLRRLSEAAYSIASAKTIDAILRVTTDAARLIVDTDDAYTWFCDPRSGEMVRHAGTQREAALSLPLLAERGVPQVGERVGDLSIFSGLGSHDLAPWIAAMLTERDQTIVGGVLVTGKNSAYSESDHSALLQLARMASAAVQNARLYREAQDANKAKDDFLATLAHELRTPVTAILGWVQLLSEGDLDEETITNARRMIDNSARVQAQIVDDLLDVSRIITGKLTLSRSALELAPLVENAVEIFRRTAASRGIRIEAEIDESPISIWGDATRIQQVIWNLLSNAVKFAKDDGLVKVILRRDEGGVAEVTVIDDGAGIKPEFLPHVFERYRQQEGGATTRAYGGLGLGLAIVRHLVTMHGGTVRALSDGDGRGATFTVRLPIRCVVPSQLSESPSDDEALSGINLLIVDDEPATRQTLREILMERGAAVREAGSVAEALEHATALRPDLIISDLAMPGEDGYALIAQLVAGRHTIPAVAVSAHGRPDDRARALASGFRKYIQKPVHAGELIRAVRSIASEVRE